MKSRLLYCFLLTFCCATYTRAQTSQTYQAPNRVAFRYQVILPSDYQEGKSYELAMVFSEVNRSDKGHDTTLEQVRAVKGLKNLILIVPEVPVGSGHWISHPIHHGLNDLMNHVRKQYGTGSQKFHFIGHLHGGRVAQTYSGMSSQYVASVSFLNSLHWENTRQQYFDQIFKKGFQVYVYSEMAAKLLSIDVSKTSFTQVSGFEQALLAIDQRMK